MNATKVNIPNETAKTNSEKMNELQKIGCELLQN